MLRLNCSKLFLPSSLFLSLPSVEITDLFHHTQLPPVFLWFAVTFCSSYLLSVSLLSPFPSFIISFFLNILFCICMYEHVYVCICVYI